MRVEQLGEGTPDVAVVAGIHGDEPCGVQAVESILSDPPAVERPVKFVVANEAAIDQGVRYVDADLNRSFPGDADATAHETRLAAELTAEVSSCTTLSLHSTCSQAEPFAVVEEVDDLARKILPALSVDTVVATGSFVEGRLFASAGVVEVECGLQGSDAAADNAQQLITEFLAALGVLDVPVERRAHPLYRLTRLIPKPEADEYEVFAENFERVGVGERYAAADGAALRADEPFYPVLLSADGYESLLGYAAESVGTIP